MGRDLEIMRLFQDGKSSIRIANQVAISRTAVMKALRRLGLIPIEKQVTKSDL
jgi:DNA-binding CsgD family transcriptional regulator